MRPCRRRDMRLACLPGDTQRACTCTSRRRAGCAAIRSPATRGHTLPDIDSRRWGDGLSRAATWCPERHASRQRVCRVLIPGERSIGSHLERRWSLSRVVLRRIWEGCRAADIRVRRRGSWLQDDLRRFASRRCRALSARDKLREPRCRCCRSQRWAAGSCFLVSAHQLRASRNTPCAWGRAREETAALPEYWWSIWNYLWASVSLEHALAERRSPVRCTNPPGNIAVGPFFRSTLRQRSQTQNGSSGNKQRRQVRHSRPLLAVGSTQVELSLDGSTWWSVPWTERAHLLPLCNREWPHHRRPWRNSPGAGNRSRRSILSRQHLADYSAWWANDLVPAGILVRRDLSDWAVLS